MTSAAADIHITSFTTITDFKSTIEGAAVGDVIFIDGSLTIDLSGMNDETGEGSIYVPEGVTIASDRGISLGALLIKSDHFDSDNAIAFPVDDANPILLAAGPNVRITGLRFDGGHNLGIFPGTTRNYGVGSVDQDNLEVDNCDFANFRGSGVVIGFPNWIPRTTYPTFTTGSSVHHNFMHENNTRGHGAGVTVGQADIKIYANRFYWNRTDISTHASGVPSYEAYCNTVEVNEDGAGGTHFNFSVNGVGEGVDRVAGNNIWIHHNDFEDTGYLGAGTHSRYNSFRNVVVWGAPTTRVLIENNRVALANQDSVSPLPFQQRDELSSISISPAVRYTVRDNVYDGAPVPSCRDGMMNQDETGIDCGGSCSAACD